VPWERCAGTDRAPTLVNPDHFKALSDADLQGIIVKGKGKMPRVPSAAGRSAGADEFYSWHSTRLRRNAGAGRCEGGRRDFFLAREDAACAIRCAGREGRLDLTLGCRAKAAPAGHAAGADGPGGQHSGGIYDGDGGAEEWEDADGISAAQGSHDVVLQDDGWQAVAVDRQPVQDGDAGEDGGDAAVCGDGGGAAECGRVSEHTDGRGGVGALKADVADAGRGD